MNNQMNNAVRKIHNLHSSGAVTVTGLSQPRILKQKVVAPSNNVQQHLAASTSNRCYVCDEALTASQVQNLLTESQTSHTSTKFPNKIGQLVGDAFMVIVSVEDVVCSRCTHLLNYLDKLESDVERVRSNLMTLLHRKYGLNDEGGGGATSPPIKLQKLNSGTATRTLEDSGEMNRVRKVIHTSAADSTIGKQSPPVSAVQQMKIATQVVQNSAGTQTIQRKAAKIYKCLSCDYKTQDMRVFNTHYETCKQQNFQCKNCKKIFPNFGTMKQHMVHEHNTTMDNTCAVCHINLVNDAALRKHMEANHSTSVMVTSTTTVTGQPAVDSITSGTAGTPLYSCNHCQFKSTDKAVFDEHFRKHLAGAKQPGKPFKCRLCAQRFETREAATVHAKQHQPNYFKCGTCSLSFPKRELLVKHFEVHQQQQQHHAATPTAVQTTVQQHQQVVAQPAATVTTTVKHVVAKQQQQVPAQNLLTTQKLLQETIDEALSDNVNTGSTASGAADVGNAAANNIRFFSCQICSLTFLQEHYFNQHMEVQHKGADTTVTASTTAPSVGSTTMTTLNPSGATTALLSSEGVKGENEASATEGVSVQQGHSTGIYEADIESIFEKMHSDKGDAGTAGTDAAVATSASNTGTTNTTSAASGGGGAAAGGGDNLVITSQEGSGGITFNITIPQPDGAHTEEEHENAKSTPSSSAPVSVSIDMPMLDQPEEKSDSKKASGEDAANSGNEGKGPSTVTPVSMPSLDDDNDAQEHAAHSVKTEESSEAQKSEGSGNGAHEDVKEEKHAEVKKDVNTAEGTATEEAGQANAEEHGEGNAGEQATAHGEEGEGAVTVEQMAAAAGEHQQVSMELDEAMQAQVEGGQIKFILNENGLLQLDNHIITDADGNQILVQDPEQIQQLLQSVGVLQSGDGLDGETLQMMTDANGQMVLVQGENNETQLIDASLLNADGQLVIQQGQDGELGEGAHVIGEDGTRIPVSVSYTPDGQPMLRVQEGVLEASERTQHVVLEKEGTAASEGQATGEAADGAGAAASGGDGSSGGDFFALADLMQQSSENKAAE